MPGLRRSNKTGFMCKNGFYFFMKMVVISKMPNCRALKSGFIPCTHHVLQEGDLCGTHINAHARRVQQSGPHQAGKCEAYLSTHRWCSHNAILNERLCQSHIRIRQNTLRKIEEEDEDRRLVNELILEGPIPTWQQVMDRIAEDTTRTFTRRYSIAWRFYTRIEDGMLPDRFRNRWGWVVNGRVGPEPIEIPANIVPNLPVHITPRARNQRLDLIAADRQNVHTTPVTNQTNAGIEKILKVDVPKNQDTQRILTEQWLFNTPEGKRPAFNTYLKVINDVNKWFTTRTCRATNDDLYRNILRGSVALVNKSPKEIRDELFTRLWEECLESVDMCCEGHITRLCNVFVGFDDTFKPPVPFGEILQDKMSAIANSEASEEEKKRQANAFFEEYAIPQIERVAWLEAF